MNRTGCSTPPRSSSRRSPRVTRASPALIFDRVVIVRREALRTVLGNQTPGGGGETINLFTTELRNGNLFYIVAVAPEDAFPSYRGVFDRVIASIQLND